MAYNLIHYYCRQPLHLVCELPSEGSWVFDSPHRHSTRLPEEMAAARKNDPMSGLLSNLEGIDSSLFKQQQSMSAQKKATASTATTSGPPRPSSGHSNATSPSLAATSTPSLVKPMGMASAGAKPTPHPTSNTTGQRDAFSGLGAMHTMSRYIVLPMLLMHKQHEVVLTTHTIIVGRHPHPPLAYNTHLGHRLTTACPTLQQAVCACIIPTWILMHSSTAIHHIIARRQQSGCDRGRPRRPVCRHKHLSSPTSH